ncbi:SLC13 family permease [uncultured Senegalimassilia sp.]|uniref:SLC13 family permease n=1 Tax=uncultured Senegalimassilia sp. TaxID=1714350 RepID=UPI0025F2A21A|nr:SLC13 family permease [uncultured Senegalimassilia sp.]
MLVVAVAAAVASRALVPPDAGYAAYVDWHTLALLFCLMAVVAGFRSLGVLDAAGAWLVARARTQRAVAGVLVGLAFFASMAVTNDVALITFVPLALVVLRRAGMEGRVCLVATLMTIAANLGSMFTPVGNPQNLYLFTASGMSVGEFLQLMGPYTAASGLLLALACALCFRGEEVRGAGDVDTFAGFSARTRKRLTVYGALFACCLAAVPGVLDVRVLLALVLVGVSLSDASLLRRVDWGLLATFAALFVFVGNMGRVPVLHEALSAAVGGNALLAAVGGSQVISNVPAAVLLSGFTDQWEALIVGTNLGGLGTLIASMASLITFKAVMVGRPGIRGRYLLEFTAWNVAFLAVLLALAVVLGAA